MTAGWAALNTLREALPKRAQRHRVEAGIEYVYGDWRADEIDSAHDALALVEAALDAAERVDEASAAIPVVVDDVWAACEELHRALRAVREGK